MVKHRLACLGLRALIYVIAFAPLAAANYAAWLEDAVALVKVFGAVALMAWVVALGLTDWKWRGEIGRWCYRRFPPSDSTGSDQRDAHYPVAESVG